MKKEIKIIPSPTEGEKDIQKKSSEFNEQVPRKHPHGETGENDKQPFQEHLHGFITPVDTEKKNQVKRRRKRILKIK